LFVGRFFSSIQGSQSSGHYWTTKFESLRPFYVKKLKERNTCCCIYHVEIDQLQLGLNNMNATFELHGIKKCNCTCPYICLKNVNQFSSNVIYFVYPCITMTWQILICPKKYEDEWHHKKCLYGQCSDYGNKNFHYVQ